MRPPVLNPLFAALSALPGIGPKLEKLFSRLLARDGEHGARHRSIVPSAHRLRRPAQPAKTFRGRSRHDRDRRGDRRPPPAAAVEPAARAVQYRHLRRHQHADDHLFQRAPGLSGKALSRRRAALCVGHRHALRRPSADAASRPRGRRGGVRQPAADRPGLSADRGVASEPGAQGARSRARSPAGTAGMAGCRVDQSQRLSKFWRCAPPIASPGRAGGYRAGERRVVAARL